MNNHRQNARTRRGARRLAKAAVAVLALIALTIQTGCGTSGEADGEHIHADQVASTSSHWTCSMHPQIQLPEPGKCPICFMDLIVVESGGGREPGPRQLHLSEQARALARIETVPVRRAFAEANVRMVGRVTFDETRLAYITAWVPGRLDRLYADYTGVTVKAGDPLAAIYSPELVATQEELVQAHAVVSKLAETQSATLRQTAEATLRATREKLRLLGLTPEQIRTIETSGQTSEHLTIHAPQGGVVVQNDAREGMYVSTGTRIYTIADLSHVWVLFEAYELDLPWLAVGQPVEFTVNAFPGERFAATISFIDPVVDPQTRTVRVRAELGNSGGRLKPDMFVRGTVQARLDTGGELVPRGQTGDELTAPLLIPTSAALVTGRRAVVYVELPTDDGALFEGREVVLGPRAGDHYIVESGLEEGEQAVTHGAFKIDAELQIQAKTSLMSPAGESALPHSDHVRMASSAGGEPETVREILGPLYDAYFDVQMALASDDGYEAQMSAQRVSDRVDDVDMGAFSPGGHEIWMRLSPQIQDAAAELASAADIDGAREAFFDLSQAAIALHDAFGHAGDGDFYLTYCPMAFGNTGAYWLQTEDIVWNSYYGAAMLRCGKIAKSLPPGHSESE